VTAEDSADQLATEEEEERRVCPRRHGDGREVEWNEEEHEYCYCWSPEEIRIA
jgi:hypothetical protein